MSLDLATHSDRQPPAPQDCAARSASQPSDGRIGIMLPNWIGDVVMATPALRALRRYYGRDAELVGIMNPSAAEVLAGTDFLDDVVLYQRRATTPELGMLPVARRLRRRNFNSLLLLTNSFSSALLGCLVRVPCRVGYARYGREALLTTRIRPQRSGFRFTPVSAVDYYLRLAYAVGCPVESPRLELAVSAADQTAADEVLRRLQIDAARPLVTLNNGGAYGGAKKWPIEHMVRLAQYLVRQTAAAVLVVCGPAERSEAAAIEREAASDRVRSLAAVEPSLGLTKALVARSRVVVSTDSGVRHFAAAFDVPCITLFGPTDPRWSHNYHSAESIMRLDLPCAPCGHRTCPVRHHRCLRDLSASGVFEAVRKRLDGEKS